jgi:hypothetical protein
VVCDYKEADAMLVGLIEDVGKKRDPHFINVILAGTAYLYSTRTDASGKAPILWETHQPSWRPDSMPPSVARETSPTELVALYISKALLKDLAKARK